MNNKTSRIRMLAAFIACMLFTIAITIAQDATPYSPPVTPEPTTTFQTVMINVLYCLGGVFGLLMAWVGNIIKNRMRNEVTASKAMDAVTEAVSRKYVEVVRDLKAAGKFDSEQKKKVAKDALELAKELAHDESVRAFITHLGASLIETAVTKLKGGTKLELNKP